MKTRNTLAAIVLLSAVSLWAQAPATQGSSAFRRAPQKNAAAAPPSASAMSQQIQDLEDTLSKMHVVLKQMQAKATGSNDRAMQDNLRLWELMVRHLDSTVARARMQAAERADMISRRETTYKQMFGQTPAGAPVSTGQPPQAMAPGMPVGGPAPAAEQPAPKQ